MKKAICFSCQFTSIYRMSVCKRGEITEVEKSFSNQKVASSIPCRSVLEQDTEPLIAPDVQCAISVNVKCVHFVSRTYVSRFVTHFTFTLMAHCTSGAIRGSV